MIFRMINAGVLGLAVALAGSAGAGEKAKDANPNSGPKKIEKTFSFGDGGSGAVTITVGGDANFSVEPGKPSEYWIGLGCGPVPEAVRAHLNLPEEQGLIVLSIHEDSPATKAGFKEHDVLVKAGDSKLGQVADLIRAVETAKGKKLSIELFRAGKKTKIEVEPAKRPVQAALALPGIPGVPGVHLDPGGIREMLENLQKQGKDPLRFQYFGPGAILPPQAGLPSNMSILIQRSGSEPAKITVKRGEEKWEVTEKELDKLPPDVRVHVAPMVHSPHFMTWGGPGPRVLSKPEKPVPAPQVKPSPETPSDKRIDRRLDDMKRQLDDMRRAIDELRKEKANKKLANKI